jgi:hypothetical protein
MLYLDEKSNQTKQFFDQVESEPPKKLSKASKRDEEQPQG